jgi:hypothetical protein
VHWQTHYRKEITANFRYELTANAFLIEVKERGGEERRERAKERVIEGFWRGFDTTYLGFRTSLPCPSVRPTVCRHRYLLR